jgi:hypothetical protein
MQYEGPYLSFHKERKIVTHVLQNGGARLPDGPDCGGWRRLGRQAQDEPRLAALGTHAFCNICLQRCLPTRKLPLMATIMTFSGRCI